MEPNFLKCQARGYHSRIYPLGFVNRRSSLLPSEECFPLKGHRHSKYFYDLEQDESTANTDLSSEKMDKEVNYPRSGVKMRNERSDGGQPYELRAMVNRSDSEKLGEVKFHFKSEVHIQNLSPTKNASYRNRTASFEQRSDHLPNRETFEMFDIPKAPFWFRRQTTDFAVPSSFIGRRRQLSTGEAKIVSSRRESNTSEERKERMLEILREIVRKCTIPDPANRPTANELLHILTMKTNILREV